VKAEVAGTLPMGAAVGWRDADDRFVELADGPHAGRFLHRRHLLPAGGDRALDWVEVALSFVGSPYRWGGRSRAGVDCSGLVQVARQVAGHACRRDSDMQAADAAPLDPAEAGRGDLACWPGHIGILLDSATLLHANAHWMRCVVEPLAAAAGRVEQAVRFRRP
jgi:cell wall-associated NlpC family hydrolase